MGYVSDRSLMSSVDSKLKRELRRSYGKDDKNSNDYEKPKKKNKKKSSYKKEYEIDTV